jgi:hypothetical protein
VLYSQQCSNLAYSARLALSSGSARQGHGTACSTRPITDRVHLVASRPRYAITTVNTFDTVCKWKSRSLSPPRVVAPTSKRTQISARRTYLYDLLCFDPERRNNTQFNRRSKGTSNAFRRDVGSTGMPLCDRRRAVKNSPVCNFPGRQGGGVCKDSPGVLFDMHWNPEPLNLAVRC